MEIPVGSEAYGDGPERAILQMALLQVLDQDVAFWRQRDGVYHPTTVPNPQQENTIRLNVVGTLMVLILFVFGSGAAAVSPLISTLLFKKAQLPPKTVMTSAHLRWSLSFLAQLDKKTAISMIPWMVLKHEGKPPSELLGLMDLFSRCEIDVSTFVDFSTRIQTHRHACWIYR